jgi:hypothetical protein
MKNEIKKFIKNNKAKMKATSIMLLMIMVCLTAMLIPTGIKFVDTAKGAYTDFDYYKHIVILPGQIDSTLTNFPLHIKDDTGDLQGNVQADGSDIAFFSDNNASQLNHEIEWYDSSTGTLYAWVNVTSISDSDTTDIYMYYGDSDGGHGVGYNPTDVWDTGFGFVIHFNEPGGTNATAREDSTANNRDADPYGFDGDEDTTGTITGVGDDLDGADDYLQMSVANVVPASGSFTIELWMKTDNNAQTGQGFSNNNNQVDRFSFIPAHNSFSDSLRWYAAGAWSSSGSTNCADNNWHYQVVTRSGNSWTLDIDDSEQSSASNSGTLATDVNYRIGNSPWGNEDFDGLLDELRVSTVARSNAWLKATYQNIKNPSNVYSLGTQTEGANPSVFTLNGLSSPYGLTWSGTGGDIVWSNSSGDAYETMNISMDVNDTDNVTELRIYIDDMNDTTAYINASNVTLFVSSDNSSFGEMGTFADGGSNVTINATTWNAGTMGADPFAGVGIHNGTHNIYCRFKLAIPSDSPTDTFTSATTTSWKVYIGYYE